MQWGEIAEPGKVVALSAVCLDLGSCRAAQTLGRLSPVLGKLSSAINEQEPFTKEKAFTKEKGVSLQCCSLLSHIPPSHWEQGCLWGGCQLGGTAGGLP